MSGPGLNAPLVTARTAGRIRAGVAHPVIAAGIAAVLVSWRSAASSAGPVTRGPLLAVIGILL